MAYLGECEYLVGHYERVSRGPAQVCIVGGGGEDYFSENPISLQLSRSTTHCMSGGFVEISWLDDLSRGDNFSGQG